MALYSAKVSEENHGTLWVPLRGSIG